MKSSRLNQVILFFYWVVLLISGKALFLIYHASKTAELTFGEILNVFGYGLWLDVSLAGYLSVIPFTLLVFAPLLPAKFIRSFLAFYIGFIVFVLAFLTTVDLQLYTVWGFRLDATPLQYLNTPKEMLASSASAPVLLLLFCFFLQLFLGYFFYKRILKPLHWKVESSFFNYLTAFWWLIFLILPIRGGWQQIPVNQSDVYFSDKSYANHSAVNVAWNFGYSITKHNYETTNPYAYMDEKEAESLVKNLYTKPAVSGSKLLKAAKPNVLFIILESYTAKLVGCVGGEKGITPKLDKIAKEGILFTNFYASGDRSEKGLVALLSGYPAQTTTSIIKIPRKTEKLPHLGRILKKAGYATSYYYGGELAFANIKSYLVTAGYDKLISKPDFNARDYNSKWGVHDHVLLNRVLNDLKSEKQPFFTTVFTLSSHEPYEVPMKTKFPGTDEASQFRNAFFYTDQAVGNFIKAAKKESWWNNTLVVLVADHGHALPESSPNDVYTKFHIPLILTGGALAVKDTVITNVRSQTDLAYSLLNQLKLPVTNFNWSQDIFNPKSIPFAFYVFNDGFGYINSNGKFSFDNVSKKPIRSEGEIKAEDINVGKAYMQYSFSDYIHK